MGWTPPVQGRGISQIHGSAGEIGMPNGPWMLTVLEPKEAPGSLCWVWKRATRRLISRDRSQPLLCTRHKASYLRWSFAAFATRNILQASRIICRTDKYSDRTLGMIVHETCSACKRPSDRKAGFPARLPVIQSSRLMAATRRVPIFDDKRPPAPLR